VSHPATTLAHRSLALTARRPEEVLSPPWAEVANLGGAEPVPNIPASMVEHDLAPRFTIHGTEMGMDVFN
jgi:hypothetical protein